MLNISGTREVVDPTYRYRMPRMVTRTEGSGNGIKTCIVNMKEIADALVRVPEIVTKFFGVELGAQSRWESGSEKSTVNGDHSSSSLQKLLNVFIDKFVLCPKCRLPETSLSVRRDNIYQKCKACGSFEPCESSHKLCAYIVKTHKSNSKSRRRRKGEKGDNVASGSGETEERRRRRERRRERREKEGLDKSGDVTPASSPVDSDDCVDTDPQADSERDSTPRTEPANSESDDNDAALDFSELRSMTESLSDPSVDSKVHLSVQNLLPFMTNIFDDIKSPSYLKELKGAVNAFQVTEDIIMSVLVKAATLDGIEPSENGTLPRRLRIAPLVFNALYQDDILSEETILQWDSKEPTGSDEEIAADNAVKSCAAPFLSWLKESDDEDEDDESD